MGQFSGKTALITGCNRGIGKATLQKFAMEGANIIACIRKDNHDFYKLTQELSNEYRCEIKTLYCDLNDEGAIKTLIKELYTSKQRVDILVNNAGIVTMGMLQMTSMEELKRVFQINFFSHVQITQGISKIMMRQKYGVIVNMSSVGCLDSFPAYTAYGCSKAALSYFTRTMAKELAPYNIRVNAIAPGQVLTDMQSELSDKAKDEILSRCAMGRMASPDEIADTILYLSSDKSSFITGQTIRVDGGL